MVLPLCIPKEYDLLFVGDIQTPLNSNWGGLLRHSASRFDVAVLSGAEPGLPAVRYLGETTDPRALNLLLSKAKLLIGSDRLGDIRPLNSVPEQYIFYDDEFFIRQRTYMAMGAGSCYLVERHPENETEFEDGRHLMMWDDYDDLARKAAGLLKDDGERRRIGQEAYALARTQHSTQVRARQLFEIMGVLPG